jgi:hypothetical protein
MKLVEQNVLIVRGEGKIKVQFNFCQECPHFKGCYPEHERGPMYISPECSDIGKTLGYDT